MRSILILSVAVLAACAQQPAQNSTPGGSSAPSAAPAPRVTGEGVVDYGSFKALVARNGDTVTSLAQRHGLSPTRLGAYNGLEATHRLRAGDELVLPPTG